MSALLLLIVPATPARAQETIEYYGTDHLGSVRVVFDAAGTVLARADYLPYGEELATIGPVPAQKFTGQARDAEAGQDYFHARMYQPRTGRFNAVDPVYAGLFQPQKWNRYEYALNNPVALTDPSGLDPRNGYVQYCPPSSGSCVYMPSQAASAATAGPRSNIGFMSVDMGRAERTFGVATNISQAQRWQEAQLNRPTVASVNTAETYRIGPATPTSGATAPAPSRSGGVTIFVGGQLTLSAGSGGTLSSGQYLHVDFTNLTITGGPVISVGSAFGLDAYAGPTGAVVLGPISNFGFGLRTRTFPSWWWNVDLHGRSNTCSG